MTQTNANGVIHVAHLIEALGPGGAERLLYTNLKHLAPERFRNTVLTVFPHATHWADPIRRLGIHVVSLDCRSYRDLPVGAARLWSWLRQEKLDLLHTHLWAANILGRVVGRLVRIPVISSVHNPDYEAETWDDGAEGYTKKRALIRTLDRWTMHFGCARVIAVSEYVRQSTCRQLRFPLERMELLYNPLDIEEFQSQLGRGCPSLVRELGLPKEALVLLNVARVSPQKGLLYAIQALPAIRERYPTVHLVSVGATTDTQWLARLKAEASSLDVTRHVHILGPRRDIPDLLRSCHVFLFPSLYEGLGLALIEAMASGCACVAANTGPIPEIIRHGVDGWLVLPRDVTSLTEAVCELLANPERREMLGKAAAMSALTRFNPQIAAERLAGIYDLVLNCP